MQMVFRLEREWKMSFHGGPFAKSQKIEFKKKWMKRCVNRRTRKSPEKKEVKCKQSILMSLILIKRWNVLFDTNIRFWSDSARASTSQKNVSSTNWSAYTAPTHAKVIRHDSNAKSCFLIKYMSKRFCLNKLNLNLEHLKKNACWNKKKK